MNVLSIFVSIPRRSAVRFASASLPMKTPSATSVPNGLMEAPPK